MSRTFHLRAVPLSSVVEAVSERLRDEGFARFVEPPDEPGVYRAPDPAVRRIVVTATPDSDWVTVADERFSTTAWGERLSRAFERPVLFMDGECDHAFYTHAVVYEDGAEVTRAEVPRDVVLDDDGRHRIRPVSLSRIAPEAKAALEAGVVVDELGGEHNVRALGKALGIADAMPEAYEPPPGATLLTFRFDKRKESVDYLPNERDPLGLSSMLGEGGLSMLENLPAGEAGMAALLGSMMKGFGAALAGGRPEDHGWSIVSESVEEIPDGPVRIELNALEARVGAPAGFMATIELAPDVDSVRGVVVEIDGDALDLLDIDELSAHLGAATFSSKASASETPGVRRFAFADVVLAEPLESDDDSASAGARGLPLGEAIRQSVNDRFNRVMSSVAASQGKRLVVRGGAMATRAGRGTLNVRVMADGQTVEAKPLGIEIREALRLPKKPAWSVEKHPASIEHDVVSYRGKEHAVGWLAFRGPWSDVAAVVESIALRFASAGIEGFGPSFAARVQLEDGALTFRGPFRPAANDPTWTKIRAALSKRADLTLHVGENWFEGPTLCIEHHPNDYVLVGEEEFSQAEREMIPVTLTWSIPTPASAAERTKLARLAEAALIEAGAVSATLGGFAGAQGSPLGGVGEAPYPSIIGTRLVDYRTAWVAAHVKTPAWLVLAPEAAASKLLPRPSSKRVEAEKLAHATLLRSSAADPFVYDADDADAMEEHVIPAMGTREEIARHDPNFEG